MKTFLSLVLITIIAIALFALTIRGVWGNPQPSDVRDNLDQTTKPLELSPERGRFLLTQNLVDNHTFALSQELANAAYPDVGVHEGRYYVQFAPGMSIFAVPFYELGYKYNLSQVGTFAIAAMFATLNLIFLFLISKHIFKLSIPTSFLVAIIFGFATTGWSYAVTLYQHQATVFFIMSSFYFAWRYRKGGWTSFIWAALVWVEYALATLIDYPNIFLMLPIMVYFFLSSMKFTHTEHKIKFNFRLIFILSAVGFLLITYYHGIYNSNNFGSPLRTSQTLTSYKAIREGLVATDSGALSQLEATRSAAHTFQEDRTINGTYELLTAPDKGILIFSPLVLLSLIGFYLKRKHFVFEDGTLFAVIIINLALYASFGDPWGGWAFGPRYLIPSMAILAIYTGIFLEKTKYVLISKSVAILLFAFSVAVALLGALTTNAVPPKTEADFLHSKYGFMFNWDFLMNSHGGSFLYNNYFHNSVTLPEYFLYIFLFLVFLGTLLIMFIPSRRENHEH